MLPSFFSFLTELLALLRLIEGPHPLGGRLLLLNESVPLLVDNLVVASEHSLLIRDQTQKEVISAHVGVPRQSFLIHASDESFLKHVNELIDKGQLENLLVHHSEHDFELLVDLPLEEVVVVAKLLLRALVVLEQHAPDKDVEELNVECLCVKEGLAPEQDPACRENAHVVKHFISSFINF